jgi:hypothetical protein
VKSISQTSNLEEFPSHVRLTSSRQDYDPEMIVKVLRMNKIQHHRFNPTFENKMWTNHFKEVLGKKIELKKE